MQYLAKFFSILCCFGAVHAVAFSAPVQTITGLCGAYASVIESRKGYVIYTNAINSKNAPCPGSGCPGLVRYESADLRKATQTGVVAPNSLIDDVYNADGTLAEARMFSRPVVAKDGAGYIAIAMVMNGYFPSDGQGVPALLRSPDGINWTYHGKLSGETDGYRLFGSGMALIVQDDYPRYRFYTDGYGPKLAELYSNDGVDWAFRRDENGKIKELNPWAGNPIFASIAEYNEVYYMAASDSWPVKNWMFAHSDDGETWVSDGIMPVSTEQKNISLFTGGGALRALTTEKTIGNCPLKALRNL